MEDLHQVVQRIVKFKQIEFFVCVFVVVVFLFFFWPLNMGNCKMCDNWKKDENLGHMGKYLVYIGYFSPVRVQSQSVVIRGISDF